VRDSGAEVRESTSLEALEPVGAGWRATTRAKDGSRSSIAAGSVVLAAGGGLGGEAARIGEKSTNHPDATPEVLEMALALGAAGRDLDSWQRHPTGAIWPAGLAGYALPETTRSYGATLHDAAGERFVDELAPRDVVADAIIRIVAEGRGAAAPDGTMGAWLDTTAIDREHGPGFTADRLAYVHNRYLKQAASSSTSTAAPRCRASTPRVRSPVGCTAPTASWATRCSTPWCSGASRDRPQPRRRSHEPRRRLPHAARSPGEAAAVRADPRDRQGHVAAAGRGPL
jgi:hypothetical protein